MAAMKKLSLPLDPWEFHIFIIFSETSEQISTKLGRNVKQVVLCQICEIGADQKFNRAEGQLCVLIGPNLKHLLVRNYKVE